MPDIGSTIDFSESVSRFVGRAAPPRRIPALPDHQTARA